MIVHLGEGETLDTIEGWGFTHNLMKLTPPWRICKKKIPMGKCTLNFSASLAADARCTNLASLRCGLKVHHNAAALEGEAQAILRKRCSEVANCAISIVATLPATLQHGDLNVSCNQPIY